MITIVDSGGTNISSLLFCLQRLGVDAELSNDPIRIKKSRHVILPGVGVAAVGMQKLANNGLVKLVRNLTQPVLGICLGMQLLFESSEEGNVECLKIFPGKIKKIKISDNLVIPHMGWNSIDIATDKKLLRGVKNKEFFYFVHSYVAPVNSFTSAITTYNEQFSSVVNKENFFGTQFHPERSGEIGKKLLKNFLEL